MKYFIQVCLLASTISLSGMHGVLDYNRLSWARDHDLEHPYRLCNITHIINNFLKKHENFITTEDKPFNLSSVLCQLKKQLEFMVGDQSQREIRKYFRRHCLLNQAQVIQRTINSKKAFDINQQTGFFVVGSGTHLCSYDPEGNLYMDIETNVYIDSITINQHTGYVAIASCKANCVKVYTPQLDLMGTLSSDNFNEVTPQIAFSPNNLLIVDDFQSDWNRDQIKIFNAANGQLISQFSAGFTPMELVTFGNYITYSSGQVVESSDDTWGEVKSVGAYGVTQFDALRNPYPNCGLAIAPYGIIQGSMYKVTSLNPNNGSEVWQYPKPPQTMIDDVSTSVKDALTLFAAWDNDSNNLTITRLDYGGKEVATVTDPHIDTRSSFTRLRVNEFNNTTLVVLSDQIRLYRPTSDFAQAALIYSLQNALKNKDAELASKLNSDKIFTTLPDTTQRVLSFEVNKLERQERLKSFLC